MGWDLERLSLVRTNAVEPVTQWSYRPAAAVSLARKSACARTLSVPRRLWGKSIAGQGWHAPLQLIRNPRITRPEVAARNRSARLPDTEHVGELSRPLPSGTTTACGGWTVSAAAGRRGRPVSQLTDCAVQVLIAAITVTTIRDGRISIAGACREWSKMEAAVDRPRERKSPNRKRAVPAADTAGSGRYRSAALRRRYSATR
jgi:hypothetical protein